MGNLSHPHLMILVLAWFIADVTMPILIRFSRRLRWLDHPQDSQGHKGHTRPTPILGGVGIYLAVVFSLVLTLRIEDMGALGPLVGIFIGGTIVMIVGLLDDFRPINAMLKLLALAVATVVISRFGVCISIFQGGAENPLNVAITILWVAGVTSATNSLDHSDGTTAGAIAVACGWTFIIAWGSSSSDSQPLLSYLSVALGGGCLGFLRHNLNGGKIFLGDNGSFLLGFLMASGLVFAKWSDDPLKAFIIPVMILAVPLFDITISTFLRIKNGVVSSVKEAIVYCGKDHLAHRLAALGLGRQSVIVAIYAFGIVSGVFALAMKGIGSRVAYLSVLGTFLALLCILGAVLDRARVHPIRQKKNDRLLPPRLRWPAKPQKRRKGVEVP